MRKRLICSIVAAVLPQIGISLFFITTAAANPVEETLPTVGTDGHGHTYPGATVPFGMVQLSPDTRTITWDGCSAYHHSDLIQGTGAGCLGDVLLMPMAGEVHFKVGSPGGG